MAATETKKYYSSSRSFVSGSKSRLDRMPENERPFSKTNFMMMGGCLLMIVVGFILMSGPGSTVEGGFNPDIFSTRRIVIGPAIAFLGFLLMAFAIVWSPSRRRKKDIAGSDDDNIREHGTETEKTAEAVVEDSSEG